MNSGGKNAFILVLLQVANFCAVTLYWESIKKASVLLSPSSAVRHLIIWAKGALDLCPLELQDFA